MTNNDAELLEAMMLVRGFEEQNRALARGGQGAAAPAPRSARKPPRSASIKALEAHDSS